MIPKICLPILIITFFSCTNASFSDENQAMQKEAVPYDDNREQATRLGEQSSEATTEATATQTPLILLYQANCRLEVSDMDRDLKRIQSLVTKQGGYVSDLNIQNTSWQREASIHLRIPASHFQSTLDSIKLYAKKVAYQHISTQDVTEEYVDITSRLKTKKEVRDRYIDILRNKAKTVEEILMAEEKIRLLQEEIEAREGRLRYLKDRASMSTITVELYQELEPGEDEEEASWLSRFLEDAGDSLGFGGQLVRGIILGIMAIWPLLILAGLIIWRRKAIKARLFGRKS